MYLHNCSYLQKHYVQYVASGEMSRAGQNICICIIYTRKIIDYVFWTVILLSKLSIDNLMVELL